MKEHTRNEVISELTEYTFDNIDWDGVLMMIEDGCKGYVNFNNQELIEEWEFLFEEDIKITDKK